MGMDQVKGKKLYSSGNYLRIFINPLPNKFLRASTYIPGKWFIFWKWCILNSWHVYIAESVQYTSHSRENFYPSTSHFMALATSLSTGYWVQLVLIQMVYRSILGDSLYFQYRLLGLTELSYSPDYQVIIDYMHGVSSQALSVLFLIMGLLIGAVVRQINKRINLPYTPCLFIIGVLLGYFRHNLGMLGQAVQQISKINPHGVLMIFLPPLIFESGFNSDWHIFRKQSKQIFILAFPSVVVSACLIMFSIKLIIGYEDEYYTWVGAFLFGSILSCTDTVAVLALLKQVGAPKKFNSLIQGQSLLNDGTCMVLFTICAEIVGGNSLSVKSIILLFLSLTIGGILLGLVFGIVAAYLINRVRNDPILTLNITFSSCFVLYFIAENVNLGFKVSGIMALVSMGLYMAAFGKTQISAQAKETVHSFWKYLIYVAETTIFLIAGILVGVKVIADADSVHMLTEHFQGLGYLYLCMIMARFLSIVVFMPLLRKSGYGLTMKEVYVLTYGGLRGAVGIAFSLIVASNPLFPEAFRKIVLFHMAGCAFLTLIINAPTAGFVIRKLGLCVKSTVRQKLFASFMSGFDYDVTCRLKQLKSNKYLLGADWQKVQVLSGYSQLHTLRTSTIQRANSRDIAMSRLRQAPQRISILSQYNLDEDMLMECRNSFLFALKGLYWEKFEDHQCSSESVVLLIEAVDWDLDTIKQPMNSWDYLQSHFQNATFIALCFQMKNTPIVGRSFFSALFNRISFIYDVISTYVQTLQMCEQEMASVHMDSQIRQEIIKESSENRQLAMSYLDYYIRVSFPQITKQIQMIKASQTILTDMKLLINVNYQHGQIDDRQYKQLKTIIDGQIMQLEDIGYNSKQEDKDLDNYISRNQFFSMLEPEQKKRLMDVKTEKLLEKDEFIIKEDQKARHIFLITRGQATEETNRLGQSYLRRLCPGDIIGAYNVVNKSLRYTTSVCSDSIMCVVGFPLTDIFALIKARPELQGPFYKISLPLMSKTYKSIDIFGSPTPQQWNSIYNNLEYVRLMPQQNIPCKYGQIILDGSVKCGQAVYEGPTFLSYHAQERMIVARKKTRILRFKTKVHLGGSKFTKKNTFLNRDSQSRPSSRITQNYFVPSSQRHESNYFLNRVPPSPL